jgi:hypothetical protein
MNPPQGLKLRVSLLQCFMSKYSAPIMDEQIAAEWIRANPELYALGRDFVNRWVSRLSKLQEQIARWKHRFFGRKSGHQLSKLTPLASTYSNINNSLGSGALPSAVGRISRHTKYSAKRSKASALKYALTNNPFILPRILGECEVTDCGFKFQFLSDACVYCEIVQQIDLLPTLGWSGDLLLPYEVKIVSIMFAKEMEQRTRMIQ